MSSSWEKGSCKSFVHLGLVVKFVYGNWKKGAKKLNWNALQNALFAPPKGETEPFFEHPKELFRPEKQSILWLDDYYIHQLKETELHPKGVKFIATAKVI